jgi:hypothetical protein
VMVVVMIDLPFEDSRHGTSPVCNGVSVAVTKQPVRSARQVLPGGACARGSCNSGRQRLYDYDTRFFDPRPTNLAARTARPLPVPAVSWRPSVSVTSGRQAGDAWQNRVRRRPLPAARPPQAARRHRCRGAAPRAHPPAPERARDALRNPAEHAAAEGLIAAGLLEDDHGGLRPTSRAETTFRVPPDRRHLC